VSLIRTTDNDTGVRAAVGPVGGNHTAVMALQKRANVFEFHVVPPFV
jgi:hypothetical protein